MKIPLGILEFLIIKLGVLNRLSFSKCVTVLLVKYSFVHLKYFRLGKVYTRIFQLFFY